VRLFNPICKSKDEKVTEEAHDETTDNPVSLWLKFVKRIWGSIKKNYEIEWYVPAFLTQQSVEKMLKAIHIKETSNFPKCAI